MAYAMSWWGSRKKRPQIPKYGSLLKPKPPEPAVEPKPEPMIVEETDLTATGIHRFIEAWKHRK